MIRAAEPADVPAMIDMLGRFAKTLNAPDVVDPDHHNRMLHHLIASDGALALVLVRGGRPRGLLLAQAGYPPLAPVLTAEELAWWVDPGHRGAGQGLRRAFESWAVRIGARFAALSAFDERLVSALERGGYRRAETRLIREM